MRKVGREICEGINVGVDLDWSTTKTGPRYQDKRPLAKSMWEAIMNVLQALGALKRVA